MIITILSEPRSGSTNLVKWFYHNKDFSILFLPSDRNSEWYINKTPSEYRYITKHLLIKEECYELKNFDELISISDKIILLFRENTKEQIESWVNSTTTNNWNNQWVPTLNEDEEKKLYFEKLKNTFKRNFLDKEYFKISYEELYYRNGFQKILDYLDIDELENKNFPYGQKYRVDCNREKSII